MIDSNTDSNSSGGKKKNKKKGKNKNNDNPQAYILAVTEKGYGKCVPIESFRTAKRRGRGTILIKFKSKAGGGGAKARRRRSSDQLQMEDMEAVAGLRSVLIISTEPLEEGAVNELLRGDAG